MACHNSKRVITLNYCRKYVNKLFYVDYCLILKYVIDGLLDMSDMAHKHEAWRHLFSLQGECCKEVNDAQLKIIFQFAFLDEEKRFLLKSKPAPILLFSKSFVALRTITTISYHSHCKKLKGYGVLQILKTKIEITFILDVFFNI